MAFRTLLILIGCNVIWSAHPLMGKYLLDAFPPAQAAWLRYATAFVSYFLAVGLFRLFPRSAVSREVFAGETFAVPRGVRETVLVLTIGFSAFCFSPLMQLTGLAASRATDNAMIIAMEPLMTVLLAWLMLGERPSRLHAISFAVALSGFAMLTGLGPSTAGRGLDPHLLGNLMMLFSLLGEAMYSSAGRMLMVRHRPAAIFGSAIAVGALLLTVATWYLAGLPTWTQIAHMPWRTALSLLWLGPFGTSLSYLFWMTALQHAPVATLALTLFVQPVLGPLWGALFLGERLSLTQGLGSGLILLAVFGQTWLETSRLRKR